MNLHNIKGEVPQLPLTDDEKKTIAHILHSFEDHHFKLDTRRIGYHGRPYKLEVQYSSYDWFEVGYAIISSYSGFCNNPLCTFDPSMIRERI